MSQSALSNPLLQLASLCHCMHCVPRWGASVQNAFMGSMNLGRHDDEWNPNPESHHMCKEQSQPGCSRAHECIACLRAHAHSNGVNAMHPCVASASVWHHICVDK